TQTDVDCVTAPASDGEILLAIIIEIADCNRIRNTAGSDIGGVIERHGRGTRGSVVDSKVERLYGGTTRAQCRQPHDVYSCRVRVSYAHDTGGQINIERALKIAVG